MNVITETDVRNALYRDHWGDQHIDAYCNYVNELEADIKKLRKHIKVQDVERQVDCDGRYFSDHALSQIIPKWEAAEATLARVKPLPDMLRNDAVKPSEAGVIESGYEVAMVCATRIEQALEQK